MASKEIEMHKHKRDERISMQCPACGFIALDLPEKFINEYKCLKCQQEMLFRQPEPFKKTVKIKPGTASVNHPVHVWRKYAAAGAGIVAAGIILLFGFHAYGNHVRTQERNRTAEQARRVARERARKVALMNDKYAQRLERILDQSEPETRFESLLRLRKMAADTGEELQVSHEIDQALVRVLFLLHERDQQRLSAYAAQQQELENLQKNMEEKIADFEAKTKVLEIKANALAVKYDERERRLRKREQEAAKILRQKESIARYAVRTRKQGSKIEAQVRRLDNLEKRIKTREAELAKREKQLENREDKVTKAMVELAKRKSTKVVVVQPRQSTSTVRIYRDRYVYPAPVITSSTYSLLSPYYYRPGTYYYNNNCNLFDVNRFKGRRIVLNW